MAEITVLDRAGGELSIYEREFRMTEPGAKLDRKVVAYELVSGERVQQLDKDTFVLTRTGEKFFRIPK
jgi:hypothetical protein